MELLDTTFTCGDNDTMAEVKPKSKLTEEVSKQDTNNNIGDQSNEDDATIDVAVSTKAASNESPQPEAPTKNDSAFSLSNQSIESPSPLN